MPSNRNTLILAGIAGILLTIAGQAITLNAPTLDEGGAKYAAWLAGHRNLAITSFYLLGFGITLSTTLVVTLRQRLLSAEGASGLLANTFLVGSILWVGLVGAGLGAYGADVFRAHSISGESAQTLNDLTYISISMAAFPTALALAAASIVIIRTRTLHPALGYFGFLTAVVHLVSAGGFDTGSGFFGPQTIGALAAVLFYIWAIAGGILLMRSREVEATGAGIAAAVVTERGVFAAAASIGKPGAPPAR